ncbi:MULTISPECIES: ABC transporter permease subunit [unclassified Paraburkholderia]|uniref:ABC transporter permease subunit n=1 Tax=unclassified Paraburkholderia TaxID=2615204 RepID=UPI0021590E17
MQQFRIQPFVGQGDKHADFAFAYGAPAGPIAFVSTIKLRKAGFDTAVDTRDAFCNAQQYFIDRKLLPPHRDRSREADRRVNPLAWPTLTHVTVSGVVTLICALIVYQAAYLSEVIRSGIEAIPRGQFEAARALGLGYMTTLRQVIVPTFTAIERRMSAKRLEQSHCIER